MLLSNECIERILEHDDPVDDLCFELLTFYKFYQKVLKVAEVRRLAADDPNFKPWHYDRENWRCFDAIPGADWVDKEMQCFALYEMWRKIFFENENFFIDDTALGIGLGVYTKCNGKSLKTLGENLIGLLQPISEVFFTELHELGHGSLYEHEGSHYILYGLISLVNHSGDSLLRFSPTYIDGYRRQCRVRGGFSMAHFDLLVDDEAEALSNESAELIVLESGPEVDENIIESQSKYSDNEMNFPGVVILDNHDDDDEEEDDDDSVINLVSP